MDGEEWQGLSVRVRDGAVLGVVVGVFPDGPLAGRLRVAGEHAVAVYAIPRRAVVRRRQDCLVLDTTLVQARGTGSCTSCSRSARAEVGESGDGRG